MANKTPTSTGTPTTIASSVQKRCRQRSSIELAARLAGQCGPDPARHGWGATSKGHSCHCPCHRALLIEQFEQKHLVSPPRSANPAIVSNGFTSSAVGTI